MELSVGRTLTDFVYSDFQLTQGFLNGSVVRHSLQPLRGETPLEHSLEQRSPLLQRILNPVSNLLLNSLHLFLLLELIEQFQIEESLLMNVSHRQIEILFGSFGNTNPF